MLLLAAIGLTTVYSAVTADPPPAVQKVLFYKQIVWFMLGTIVLIAAFSFNYRMLDRWAHPIYITCLLLLLGVVIFGKLAGGSRRWLVLGPVHLQPSELIKIAIVLVLAKYYSKDATARGFTLRDLVRPILLTALPFGVDRHAARPRHRRSRGPDRGRDHALREGGVALAADAGPAGRPASCPWSGPCSRTTRSSGSPPS